MNVGLSGIQYMVLSALSFSAMAVLVKAGTVEIPEQEIIAFRSLFILAVTLPILIRKRIPILGVNRRLLILRGLLGFAAMSCYFWTLEQLPVAEAMVIQYVSPLFTILWAVVFLKETAHSRIIMAAIVCFAGVILVARPGSGGPLLGIAIGICGAALAGGAYATVRALRSTDSPHSVVFYFPLVSFPISIVLAIPDWKWPASTLAWGTLIGVAVTSYAGQIFLTKGLNLETASRAILVNYLAVAFGVLSGVLFFNTVPHVLSTAGILLVLGGLSILRMRRRTA